MSVRRITDRIAGESFNIAVQDNLTSLTQFTAMVQGNYTK